MRVTFNVLVWSQFDVAIVGVWMLGFLILTLVKCISLPWSEVIRGVVHVSDIFSSLHDAFIKTIIHGRKSFVI